MLRQRRVVVEKLFSTVRLVIQCGDEYEAEVLHEDICERLRNDGSVSLDFTGAVPAKAEEGTGA